MKREKNSIEKQLLTSHVCHWGQVRSNDDVHLMVEQENVDKNPWAKGQLRTRLMVEELNWTFLLEILMKRCIHASMRRRRNERRGMVMRHEWEHTHAKSSHSLLSFNFGICHFSLSYSLSLSRSLFSFSIFPPLSLSFLFLLKTSSAWRHTCSYRHRSPRKNSHLRIESSLVVMVIAEIVDCFRCDEWDTTFPQECRRSGL